MSHSSIDQEKGLDPEVETRTAIALDAEDEGQIRARLGKYGLGRLFDAGGISYERDHVIYG
jgi:hypothetical protein